MRRGYGTSTHVPTETRVEQALAWGRSYSWIRTHLGVTDHDIAAAIARMDAACTDDAPHARVG